MLHYDLANFSVPQGGATGKHKSAVERAKQLLEEKPYQVISLEDMKMVRISHTSNTIDHCLQNSIKNQALHQALA